MIDFYWLKSFTETIQFFISILFLVYLKVKFQKWESPVWWFVGFLMFKVLGDFYGIINYTFWIREVLTRDVLIHYFRAMGFLELSMLTCLIGFCRSLTGEILHKRQFFWFVPALLLVPLNYYLSRDMTPDSLRLIFNLVRLSYISYLIYFFFSAYYQPFLRFLFFSMLAWNILWITETELHGAMKVISEDASWVIFILAELCLTVGISYFFLQVIARPKILTTEGLNANLPSSVKELIDKKLQVEMEEHRLYRDPDLSLSKLSAHLEIPQQDITQYLNRILKQNFNQYLTHHRIKEAKALLQVKGNKEMNIQEVMFQVGFNSKSVFNTAFKSATGMTPSAYRKVKPNQ